MINIDLRLELTAAQRSAWLLIRPVIKDYLARIFRIYREAPENVRRELREHNPVLDAVLDMLGE